VTTFDAGDPLDADVLTALGAEVLDMINITTNPIITAAAFSSETDIPRMQLTAPVIAGELYLIFGFCIAGMTNTDTEANLNFRHTTAVSGTYIGSARLGRPWVINTGFQTTWLVPFVCTGSTTALNIYTSVVRSAGTGNTSITGGAGLMSHGIARAAASTSVFRTVT
jgi:hypothetical protein